ncbi:Uma2 family endonuclease [Rivularia sp. UHCC 0363]|uniref:Uma2 family endonuclease n=1 Tax=Rivularia sp. UHCC 0363 TaxID=3110244 RepID=UPI002B20729F|nr:Uma2 family endonuclease [Rivularia sp. UHCC 0363]MEA5592759.1 Uma2 family endonuclease [Rivularia sp. UHCC 0363]
MTAQLPIAIEVTPMVLKFHPVISITDEQLFEFCQLNKDFRIERKANGEIVIMSPTGSETEERNFDLTGQLWFWTKQDGTGVGFGSSGGFTLPNGAVRSPDAAWIKKTDWEAIPVEKRKKFAPLTPEFVVELRSESDSLKVLQDKMVEYIDNGAKLGWLIDRKERKVYIYRPEIAVEELNNPSTLSGEDILSGFVLDLSSIW